MNEAGGGSPFVNSCPINEKYLLKKGIGLTFRISNYLTFNTPLGLDLDFPGKSSFKYFHINFFFLFSRIRLV